MNAPVNPFDLINAPATEPVLSAQRKPFDGAPGFYTHLSNSEYHSGPGISKSGLDLVAHCPSSLPWSREAPVHDEKLKALDFGTALHTLLLEPHEFESQFAVAPAFNLRTNDGKDAKAEFEAEHGHKIIMSADDHQKLMIMADSVQAHPTARWIFEQQGVNEASIYWTDEQTGELCRVRPDRILTEHHIIVDVKKVDGMDRFEKHIEEYRYHVQHAMYCEGYKQHFGVEPDFVFLAVSSSVSAGRYAVDVVDLDPDWVRRGHELYREALETYHQCRVNDDWVHIRRLERPGWAVRNDERRMS
jgi:exodeoxyribonuclease VIII